jgi:hypothetical protein
MKEERKMKESEGRNEERKESEIWNKERKERKGKEGKGRKNT